VIEIEIYTTPHCGFCIAAKRLLNKKGVPYKEIDVMMEPAKRDEMTRRAGGCTSVPQVFIGGKHLGDCSGLMEMDQEGTLDDHLGL
jgi:glutaredoxin 3